MTYLSLFSGAGGSEWAAKLIGGLTCVGYVENDEYCQKVLRARIKEGYFDDAPIFDDVRTFDGRPYRGRVDCIFAGFPCQAFSVAGKREAAASDKNRWPDAIRIIREVQPRRVFLENVPGLLAGSHGYFGVILRELAEAGYDAEWDVLSAAEVGAPHLRKRLWIMADAIGFGRNEGRFCGPREADKEWAREAVARPSWWSAEPDVGRVAHGVAARRDRLRALGNGWVPAVAATAWEILTEGE